MVFKASSPKLLTWIKVHDDDARHLIQLSPTGVTPALISNHTSSIVAIPKIHNVIQSTFVLSCGIGLEFGLTTLPDFQKKSNGLYLVMLEAMEARLLTDIEELSGRELLPMMRTVSVCKPRLPEYENAILRYDRSATAGAISQISPSSRGRSATYHGIPLAVKRASMLLHVNKENSFASSREDTENNGHNITFFSSMSSEDSIDVELSFKERPQVTSYMHTNEQSTWTVYDYQDAYKELIGEKSLPQISDTSYNESSDNHKPTSDKDQRIDDSSSDDESYVKMHTAFFTEPRYVAVS